MHKFILDSAIQTDHLISTRQSDLVIVNTKRTYRIAGFTVSTDHWIKLKEIEKNNKYRDIARAL